MLTDGYQPKGEAADVSKLKPPKADRPETFSIWGLAFSAMPEAGMVYDGGAFGHAGQKVACTATNATAQHPSLGGCSWRADFRVLPWELPNIRVSKEEKALRTATEELYTEARVLFEGVNTQAVILRTLKALVDHALKTS